MKSGQLFPTSRTKILKQWRGFGLEPSKECFQGFIVTICTQLGGEIEELLPFDLPKLLDGRRHDFIPLAVVNSAMRPVSLLNVRAGVKIQIWAQIDFRRSCNVVVKSGFAKIYNL